MTLRMLRVLCIVLMLPAAAFSSIFAAETEPSRILTSRWGVTAGGYVADLATDAQFSFLGGLGTFFRLEDDTDYADDESVVRADAFWRFGKRHALEFEALQINRSSIGTLDRDLEILDRTFVANFESNFDMTLYKGGYRFSFQNNGVLDAGLAFGLSVFDFTFAMEGDAQITDPNGMTTISGAREETSVLAPIPSAGMFLNYAITSRLVTRARAEFFSLSTGDLEGRFIEVHWTLDYLFTKVFGIGGGWSSTDMEYKDLGDEPLAIEYRYSGLIFYLSLFFGEAHLASP